ncbi:MAG: sn-glycerol-3-phosphate ABC transporter ATP-binding protein UgpC [Pseudomonadota bacterium]
MGEVSLRRVEKLFGDVTAVAAFDLDVRNGEFLALVGPSGCGKTTTLRMIAGLERVSAGEVWIAGQNVTGLRARDRDIAMVFQNYALYPHMSVRDNVGFALRMQGLDRAAQDEKIAHAAGIMGLGALLDRLPRELSGGQRQRVAVCRAIVRDPAVFLFDEPLSNLDAQLRVSARAEIRNLQSDLGVTTVYVTHDQVEAMSMADRIVVMHEGRVQQVADPITLYERPANTFVAAFIGSPAMNLKEAQSNGAGYRLGAAHLASPVPGAARIGVRPEHLIPGEGGDLTVAGDVRLVETLGGETLVHLNDGETVWQARLPGHPRLAQGERLSVGAQAEHLHFFDGTGARLGGAHAA